MRVRLLGCALAVAAALALPPDAFAQGAASVSGVVRDATGAVLPGVGVVITNTATNERFDAFADKDGKYAVTGLKAGSYQITGSLQGFATARATVVLAAGQAVVRDLVLTMASFSENVTVTAQKREEPIVNVPMAMTAISGGDSVALLGAKSLQDFAPLVPGLQSTSQKPGESYQNLRGISTGSINTSVSVASYVDDTPLGSSSAFAQASRFSADPNPFDVQRIEVLKGPQGTLYGASSLGGLIKYVMAQPNLKQVQGKVEFGVDAVGGHGQGGTVRAMLNVPVARDVFAIRVSGFRVAGPGYIDNITTAAKNINTSVSEGARVAGLWSPSKAFSLRFTSDYNKLKVDDANTVWADVKTVKPVSGDLEAGKILAEPLDASSWTENVTAEYDFSWAHLLSSTSYQKNDVQSWYDASNLYGVLYGPIVGGNATLFWMGPQVSKTTEELRLTSPGKGSVDWVAGLFFTHEKAQLPENMDQYNYSGGTLTPVFSGLLSVTIHSTLTEIAGFGDLTYRFNPSFDVQGGLRYSGITQDYSQVDFKVAGVKVIPDMSASSKQTKATFLGTARYHFKQSMLYGRVATGYRPGGPNVVITGVSAAPPTFESDSLVNYEFGWKGEARRGSFDYGISAFRINWRDMQVVGIDPVTGFGFYDNGGRAHSQGLEVAFAVRPIRGLRLGLSGALLDAVIDEDIPVNGVTAVKGDRLPMAPKAAFTGTADYDRPIANGVSAFAGFTLTYTGARRSVFENQLVGVSVFGPGFMSTVGDLPSYTALNLRGGVTWKRLMVTALFKNVTDSRGVGSFDTAMVGADLDAGGPSPGNLTWIQPRTFALTVRVSF
jgi:iron complex outermembrane recepter protein